MNFAKPNPTTAGQAGLDAAPDVNDWTRGNAPPTDVSQAIDRRLRGNVPVRFQPSPRRLVGCLVAEPSSPPPGAFVCGCGAWHTRGPVDGVDTYRCLRCGTTSKGPPRGDDRAVATALRNLMSLLEGDDVRSQHVRDTDQWEAARDALDEAERRGVDTGMGR